MGNYLIFFKHTITFIVKQLLSLKKVKQLLRIFYFFYKAHVETFCFSLELFEPIFLQFRTNFISALYWISQYFPPLSVKRKFSFYLKTDKKSYIPLYFSLSSAFHG